MSVVARASDGDGTGAGAGAGAGTGRGRDGARRTGRGLGRGREGGATGAPGLYITVMALVIQCLCSSSTDVPKWGLYGVDEQKGVWRTVLYNGFRFVLDIVTGLA